MTKLQFQTTVILASVCVGGGACACACACACVHVHVHVRVCVFQCVSMCVDGRELVGEYGYIINTVHMYSCKEHAYKIEQIAK